MIGKIMLLISLLVSSNAVLADDDKKKEFTETIKSREKAIDYSNGLIKSNNLLEYIKSKNSEIMRKNNGTSPFDVPPDDTAPKDKTIKTPFDQLSKPSEEKKKDLTKLTDKPPKVDKKIKPKPIVKQKVYKPKKPAIVIKDPLADEPTYYIDPSLRSNYVGKKDNKNTPLVDRANKQNRVVFGITIGTKFPVKLNTGASSAQKGLIAFEVTKEVYGYKKSLPKGSILFGQPRGVIGSDRLFISISKGITPDNLEFSLKGFTLAIDGDSGLIGVVTSDGNMLARAADATKNGLIGRSINKFTKSDDLKASGAEGVSSVFDEQRSQDQAENGSAAYIVDSAPQAAFVQIEATF